MLLLFIAIAIAIPVLCMAYVYIYIRRYLEKAVEEARVHGRLTGNYGLIHQPGSEHVEGRYSASHEKTGRKGCTEVG